MSTPPPPPPPGNGDPDGANGLPTPPSFGQPGAGRLGPPATPLSAPLPPPPSRGPLIAVIAGTVVVIVLAIAVLIVRSGNDDEAAPTTTRRPTATTTTAAPRPTTTAPATTTEAPSTAPPTTAATTTAVPTTVASTLPPVPEGSIDLGRGVHVPMPEGWSTVSGPDDPLTISDGTVWFSAQVLARPVGEGPQPVLQELVDTFDGNTAAVSYSPVSLQGTIAGRLPADHYSLLYSTFDTDGARLSGRLDAYLRGDGLVAVTDSWNDSQSDPAETAVPTTLTDTLTSTLTAAPPIGPASTLAVVAPFRVTTSHPFVGSSGLAGFTLPPGFDAMAPSNGGGVAVGAATNGQTDLLGISVPAAGSVEADFAAVTDALDQRYSGLVYEQPSPQGTRDGWKRLGAGFAGTLNGRPISGGVDVWEVPGGTAYGFAYVYYADITADGTNPDQNATQFAYSAYADSL